MRSRNMILCSVNPKFASIDVQESDCTASLSLKPPPPGVPIPGRKWPPLWHLHQPWHGIFLSTYANCIGCKKTTNTLLCLHSLWWSWWFNFSHFFMFTPKNWGSRYPHLTGWHSFFGGMAIRKKKQKTLGDPWNQCVVGRLDSYFKVNAAIPGRKRWNRPRPTGMPWNAMECLCCKLPLPCKSRAWLSMA